MSNHIFRHRGLREMDVELEELPVNPRGAPQGVGLTHGSNKISDGWINKGPSRLLLATFPGPVQSEPLPVPSNDRLSLHNEESLGPLSPKSGDHDPELRGQDTCFMI